MALDGTITRKQRSRKLADYCDRYRSADDVRSLLDEILAPLNAGRFDARGTMLITGLLVWRCYDTTRTPIPKIHFATSG